MLFSNAQVAGYINRYFEPAWENVRAVPKINIDFGNGNVIHRTLHGNIATFICNSNGQILDIVTGLYTPAAFIDRLDQARLLGTWLKQRDSKDTVDVRFKTYHSGQAEALKDKKAPERFIKKLSDMSKAITERNMKVLLAPAGEHTQPAPVPASFVKPPEDLTQWKMIEEDTKLNEGVRRREVHELLAQRGLVAPDKLYKTLYKEVLHSDLDDPYLGLKPLLFANYPFKDGQ